MRVLIVGAGAVGSLLGHRLATAGHAVTLVGRVPWVEAIQSRGLGLKDNGRVHGKKSGCPNPWPGRNGAISGPAGIALQFQRNCRRLGGGSCRPQGLFPWKKPRPQAGVLHLRANLAAVADAHAVARDAFDLVVCTTKVYDMVEAIQQIAPVASKGAPLLTLQNGVGGEELASEVLPQAPLMAGVITLSVEVLAPGKICLATTSGGIGLAPVSPGAPVGDLVTALRQAGFERVRAYADYRAMKWSKLLLNIQGNALPTILGMPPAKVYAQRELFDLERTAFDEALTVMQALGHKRLE